MIAQLRRYLPAVSHRLRGASPYQLEGEKRYWLHIAIDRFTGEVIDQQIEAVKG